MSEISVIVPCYNGANFLPKCIESLVNQTIKLHEIIIVNDGSTDSSYSIACRYADIHDNIKVISKENQGLPQARKTGVEYATGKYIGFVDCDDWCAPEMYEKLYIAACEKNADIACCGVKLVYADGKTRDLKLMKPDHTLLSQSQAFHMLHSRRDVFTYMPNKLFCRRVLENIEFPTGNFTGEDYVTFIQILQKAESVITVNAPLYMYWQGNMSMSRGGFKHSHYLSQEHYAAAEAALLEAHPEMANDVHAYLAVEYMSIVLAMARGNNYDLSMLAQFQHYVRRHLFSILKCRDLPLLYKGSAVVFSVHHKLFSNIYRVLQK